MRINATCLNFPRPTELEIEFQISHPLSIISHVPVEIGPVFEHQHWNESKSVCRSPMRMGITLGMTGITNRRKKTKPAQLGHRGCKPLRHFRHLFLYHLINNDNKKKTWKKRMMICEWKSWLENGHLVEWLETTSVSAAQSRRFCVHSAPSLLSVTKWRLKILKLHSFRQSLSDILHLTKKLSLQDYFNVTLFITV